MCWTPLLTNTDHINKTEALLQITGGDDELNIVSMHKSLRTTQHGDKNVKT